MTRLLASLLLFALSSLAFAQESFHIPTDAARRFASALRPPPSYVDVRVLAANTNEDHTVPADGAYVIFSADCAEFYVKRGGTAAVPGADVTNGSGSELNPAGYYVADISGGANAGSSVAATTTLGLISPTACTVTMAWYKR